jgi:methylglutaconyl-CoA hydratase
VKIGFIPAMVLVFLIRKIGEQKAKQLLLSGELIQREEVLRMGLVNYIVSKEQLENSVFDFAQRLIKNNSAQSMRLTKQMIGEVQSMSLAQALDYAAKMNAQARATEDCKNGIAAFLEKREMRW